MNRFIIFTGFLGLAVFPDLVLAKDRPAVAAACVSCHRTESRDGPIPAIAGKPAPLLASKLRDFKADKVPNATVMPRLVKGLTEDQIDQIAAYFAALH